MAHNSEEVLYFASLLRLIDMIPHVIWWPWNRVNTGDTVKDDLRIRSILKVSWKTLPETIPNDMPSWIMKGEEGEGGLSWSHPQDTHSPSWKPWHHRTRGLWFIQIKPSAEILDLYWLAPRSRCCPNGRCKNIASDKRQLRGIMQMHRDRI